MSEPALFDERYFTSIEGLKLYYRDYHGPLEPIPVLCIPGLTRNSRDFEFIAAHMAASRRVVVADLRGRGNSEYAKDPRHYTVAVEAADTFRLMDHAKVGEIVVLGTSRGGVVAMTMAATRPDLLRGVILNDIGGEIDAPGLSRIMDFMGREGPILNWKTAAQEMSRTYARVFPDVGDARWLAFARALYREKNGQILPDYDPRLADAIRESTPNISPSGPAVPLWPLFSALAQIPTLVLRGGNSDLLTAGTLERMHALKLDLASTVVERCGHAPFLDEPEAIAAIDRFLEQIA